MEYSVTHYSKTDGHINIVIPQYADVDADCRSGYSDIAMRERECPAWRKGEA